MYRGVINLRGAYVGRIAPAGYHKNQTVAPYRLHLIVDGYGHGCTVGFPHVIHRIENVNFTGADLIARGAEMVAAGNVNFTLHRTRRRRDFAPEGVRHVGQYVPAVGLYVVAVGAQVVTIATFGGVDAGETVHVNILPYCGGGHGVVGDALGHGGEFGPGLGGEFAKSEQEQDCE